MIVALDLHACNRGLYSHLGLKLDQEILWMVDGGKGIHKGIREVIGQNSLISRCQWHKRENVLSYLVKERQPEFLRMLQAAYEQPSYDLVCAN